MQLNEIKQFAFFSEKSLDNLCEKIALRCKYEYLCYTPSEFADILWCFAKLGARPTKPINILKIAIEKRLKDFNMVELADIFYAFEELRIVSKPLLKTITSCIKYGQPRAIEELTNEQLAQFCYSVIMGHEPLNDRMRLCMKLCQKITTA